jgi:hypothetical protein
MDAVNRRLNRRKTCVDYFLNYQGRCAVAESLSSGPSDTASEFALAGMDLALATVCLDAFKECTHALKNQNDVRGESAFFGENPK